MNRITSELLRNVTEVMAKKGVTKLELAQRMGVSRSRVFQIFKSDNLTTEALDRMYEALNEDVYHIKVISEGKEK